MKLCIIAEHCYAECRLCWVSHISPLCWVSLCGMSLCWVSLCGMSLCWVSLWGMSLCWVSLCGIPLCWESWRPLSISTLVITAKNSYRRIRWPAGKPWRRTLEFPESEPPRRRVLFVCWERRRCRRQHFLGTKSYQKLSLVQNNNISIIFCWKNEKEHVNEQTRHLLFLFNEKSYEIFDQADQSRVIRSFLIAQFFKK